MPANLFRCLLFFFMSSGFLFFFFCLVLYLLTAPGFSWLMTRMFSPSWFICFSSSWSVLGGIRRENIEPKLKSYHMPANLFHLLLVQGFIFSVFCLSFILLFFLLSSFFFLLDLVLPVSIPPDCFWEVSCPMTRIFLFFLVGFREELEGKNIELKAEDLSHAPPTLSTVPFVHVSVFLLFFLFSFFHLVHSLSNTS